MITKDGLSHFVIIYTNNNKTLTVYDPQAGVQTISKDDFARFYLGIIVRY